jgi:hypothetical protein
LYRNCPDNPDRAPAEGTKIMISSGEDDPADEDVYVFYAFMITDPTETTRDRDSCSMVLFSPTEVLFDNQAGRSIFKNRSLLSNVSNVTPFYIGGIDARELMARLRYASSQATIDMIDAGMSHCDVTKQDNRNADAIFGSCIPSIQGKTHKRGSTPASAVLTPRVTQVQQILAVDLFFIKKLSFLLGELVPLGLANEE